MQGIRAQVRRVGVAMVGAIVLVLPLGPTQTAQAAPTADLSITKQVRPWAETTIAVPDDFAPTLSGTRTKGHFERSGTGLRVWTEASACTDPKPGGGTWCANKVAEYVPTDTPLSAVGEPTLEFTKLESYNPPHLGVPGFQLQVDLDDDGDRDAILVGEALYGGIWWGAEMGTTDPAIVAASPHATGGGGYPNQGTLAAWRAAFPQAKVTSFGFSLGSGVQGDGVIDALTFAGKRYTFGGWSPSITTAPGSVVEYRLTVTNDSDADIAATGTTVTDTLPADLTYVPGSLKDNGNGCAFVAKTLTCNAGTFPVGFSSTIRFKATVSNTVTSNGLPTTTGHHVDVQKQEVFADLPAGQTRSYSAWCPSGYLPTDGGLLVDAVDQGGFYSDIVTLRSKPAASGGLKGWTVTVANLGDVRGQGKVNVTCLDETIGSAHGHTHDIVVTGSTGPTAPQPTVTRTCPSGYVPVAPWFEVASGSVSVRSSYAVGHTWVWQFDYDPGTHFTYGLSCLAPRTTTTNGHSAPLALTAFSRTVTVAADSRSEGVQQCGDLSHVITGGYRGSDAALLSLGKEQRGTASMFRFWNDDWDVSRDALIQVQCVGVRTADERTYYTVTNTAHVSTSAPDRSVADDTSSAVLEIDGDPVTPPGGVSVLAGGSRTEVNNKTRSVTIGFVCTEACTFAVKVLKNDVVVAKATKSLPASTNPKIVAIPTTGAGKNLGAGQVTVKIKTESGTNTRTVTLS